MKLCAICIIYWLTNLFVKIEVGGLSWIHLFYRMEKKLFRFPPNPNNKYLQLNSEKICCTDFMNETYQKNTLLWSQDTCNNSQKHPGIRFQGFFKFGVWREAGLIHWKKGYLKEFCCTLRSWYHGPRPVRVKGPENTDFPIFFSTVHYILPAIGEQQYIAM